MLSLPVIQPLPGAAPGGQSQRGSHRLQQIFSCPRKWYFHNAKRLQPRIEDTNLRIGTLMHLALAHHYAAKLPIVPVWVRGDIEKVLYENCNGYPDEASFVWSLFRAYVDSVNDAGYTPIAVEHEFFATIGKIRKVVDPNCEPKEYDNEFISARIDLLAVVNGHIWSLDYKTVGRGTKDGYLFKWNDQGEYAIKWQMNVQSLILYVNFGLDFSGTVIQRVLKKIPIHVDRNVTTIQPRVLKDSAELARIAVLREHELVKEVLDAQARGEDMETWMPQGYFFNCFEYGRPCEYRPLCMSNSPDQIRHVLQNEFKVE